MLTGIEDGKHTQGDLLTRFDEPRAANLMAVMDQINTRFGPKSLQLAITASPSAVLATTRRSFKSQEFTTNWAELPIAA